MAIPKDKRFFVRWTNDSPADRLVKWLRFIFTGTIELHLLPHEMDEVIRQYRRYVDLLS